MTRASLPDDVLIRAALLGVFDPRELLAPEGAGQAQDLAELAALSVETAFGPLWLWTLTEDARRAGLTLLPPPGPQRDAYLARARPREGDEIGRAIRDLLAPAPRPDLRRLLSGKAARLSDERMIALFKMLELIGSAGTALPDWLAGGNAGRRLRHAIMQRRAEKTSRSLLPDRFRGRRGELTSLRDFARTGTLSGSDSSAPRHLAGVPPDGVPALLVTGIGGSGKSALIEQFRRNLQRADWVVLAHFDLDRAALRLGDQVALVQELLRQIGYALPDLDAPIAELRGQIRDAMALSQAPLDLEAGASAILGAILGLNELLAASGMNDRVLVIIIDTFEEALQLGPQRVAQIAEWLRTLRDHGGFASLRVILAGRSAETLTQMPQDLAVLGVIELDELGTDAGRAKLGDMFKRLEIPHRDLIPDLIAEFGSNPLVIEILAVYCRDKPRDEITGLMGGSDANARTKLGAEMRQRFLYTRILDRLSDPALKPLACPGLVLRRIEPAQISGLLAGPCGLPPMTPAQEQALFERLATHLWLVRRVAPGPGGGPEMLEHLPDLRRLMLPQILADPAAREVARAAAGWFTSDPGASQPGAAFDALYYAILAGDAELPEDANRLHDFAMHLGAAAGDLPADAQARLREAQGHVSRSDEMPHLQGPARDRAIRKRRETQRTHGLESSVVAEQVVLAQTGADTTGETAADSAALAQSLFATGEFDRLAEHALTLTKTLFAEILSGNPGEMAHEPLQHPAYLAALALAADDGQLQAFGTGLEAWLQDTEFLRELGISATLISTQSSGGSPLEIALLVLAVAGQLGSPEGRAFANIVRGIIPPSSVARSLLQWRTNLACGRMATDGVAATLQVMPIFAPALVPQISSDENAETYAMIEEMLKNRAADRQQIDTKMTLRKLTRIEKALSDAVLHLSADTASRADLRPVIPGRQPEFHAPLRVLLTENTAFGALPEAIAPLAEIPWWPVELRPETFSTQRNATQTLALIDMLDKFGALTGFVATLANAGDASPRLRALHRIMARAEATWAGLAGAGPTLIDTLSTEMEWAAAAAQNTNFQGS
ncbi:AAA family ATPase [Paracoccus sp. (in: a-proteobacteria)]|uniref:AAA family ATPase n=1 Tax=Paracoccus sp. TaxID=267 RepID=UPI0035B1CD37